jgi:flagellar basal-body rod modification protein FlgD
MALLPISPSTTPSAASITGSGTDKATIAENFSTFLQLLTTQLKNQNPMDPLDTNQFTSQLVQFAQVEQQMKQNDQLSQIIAIEKNAQTTVALSYVGHTVVVEGNTSQLTVPGVAGWTMNITKPATATVTVKDATGQTCYTGTFSVTPGQQNFTWDGKGNDGKQWPAGNYTLTATAKDASGETSAISTEIIAVVDSVDLTKDPPILSINGKDYTVDQIKRVLRPIVTAPPPTEESAQNNVFSQLLSALPLGL